MSGRFDAQRGSGQTSRDAGNTTTSPVIETGDLVRVGTILGADTSLSETLTRFPYHGGNFLDRELERDRFRNGPYICTFCPGRPFRLHEINYTRNALFTDVQTPRQNAIQVDAWRWTWTLGAPQGEPKAYTDY